MVLRYRSYPIETTSSLPSFGGVLELGGTKLKFSIRITTNRWATERTIAPGRDAEMLYNKKQKLGRTADTC